MERYTGSTECAQIKRVTGLQFEATVEEYARIYGIDTLQKVVEVIREGFEKSDRVQSDALIALRQAVQGTKSFKLLQNSAAMEDALSFDAPILGVEDFSVLDSVPDHRRPEDALSYTELITQIRNFLISGSVDNRECKVLAMRLGIDCEPRIHDDIAHQLSITRERVRQIEDRAKQKLRLYLRRINAV